MARSPSSWRYGCDPCPLDNPDDSDFDGICNSADICAGFDDLADMDSDSVPNGCDSSIRARSALGAAVDGDGRSLGDIDLDCDPDLDDYRLFQLGFNGSSE